MSEKDNASDSRPIDATEVQSELDRIALNLARKLNDPKQAEEIPFDRFLDGFKVLTAWMTAKSKLKEPASSRPASATFKGFSDRLKEVRDEDQEGNDNDAAA